MPSPILVTRPQPQANDWVAQLHRHGIVSAQALPLIEIAPSVAAQNPAQLKCALGLDASRGSAPDACMFVSAAAVTHTFTQLRTQDFPAYTRFWTVGPATARALIEHGIDAHRIDAPAVDAPQFDSEALWRCVASRVGANYTVAILRGDDGEENTFKKSKVLSSGTGREWLTQMLRSHGASVRTVAVYERRVPALAPTFVAALQNLAQTPQAIWVFSSAQAAENLATLIAAAGLPPHPWPQHRALATHARIRERVCAVLGLPCETVSGIFEDIVPVLNQWLE